MDGANPDPDFELGALSDPGRKRHTEPNQDTILVLPADQERGLPSLLIVADGMGGYLGGAVASQKVVETVAWRYRQAEDASDLPGLLEACLQAAFSALCVQSLEHPDLSSMGSTAVLAAILNGRVFVANVGDSRAYLVRGRSDSSEAPATSGVRRERGSRFSRIWSRIRTLRGKRQAHEETGTSGPLPEMMQLNFDHSVVADQVRAGLITPLQARLHPRRNRLTQSITPKRKEIRPFHNQVPFEEDDTLILCSDGLWGVVPEAILQAIAMELPPQQAAEKLVSLANQNGGPDNISVIIARRAGATPAPSLDKKDDTGGWD
jgi:serine/threonine protein phosphatase PrpC